MIMASFSTVCASFGTIYNPDFLAECSRRNYCRSTVCVFFLSRMEKIPRNKLYPTFIQKQGILNCWYAYLAAGFQLKSNSLSNRNSEFLNVQVL